MIRVAVMAQVRETFIDSGSIMVLPDSQWEKFSSCEILKTFVTIVCREWVRRPHLSAGSLFLFGKVQWRKDEIDGSFHRVFGSTG